MTANTYSSDYVDPRMLRMLQAQQAKRKRRRPLSRLRDRILRQHVERDVQ